MEVNQTAVALSVLRATAGVALLDDFALAELGDAELVFRPIRPITQIAARAYIRGTGQCPG